MNEQYLDSVKRRFNDYKSLGEKAIAQLKDEDLFKSPNEDSNSIAIIIQHLWGNMMSRWTHFLTEDGEKPWRERDAEFENMVKTKDELMQKWEEGWKCVFDTLNSLQPDQLLNTVYINRQLAHYPYHIGQIVYAAKMLKGGGFQSLSIPKGKSKEFNSGMMKK
jgi:hypothetical protein